MTMKAKRLGAFEIKAADKGEVEAVLATFNVVDLDGDVVLPGAFEEGAELAILWSHKWDSRPVGRGAITKTETEARIKGHFFMDTLDGREAFLTVKNMGALQEWSWGFKIPLNAAEWGEFDTGSGVIEVQYLGTNAPLDVYEASPVLRGASVGSRTVEVKAAPVLVPDLSRVPGWAIALAGSHEGAHGQLNHTDAVGKEGGSKDGDDVKERERRLRLALINR
jgi:phage head maturation protease